MTIVSEIFDHIARGLSVLLSQFDTSDRLKDFTAAFLAEVQELEAEAFNLIRTSVDEAVGDALDQWGKIVGEPREGLNDTDFRAFLQVRLTANRSNGNPAQIADILSTMVGVTVRYALVYPGGYSLYYVVGTPTSAEFRVRMLRILLDIRPAGVELIEVLESTGLPFGFAGDPEAGGYGVGAFTTENLIL